MMSGCPRNRAVWGHYRPLSLREGKGISSGRGTRANRPLEVDSDRDARSWRGRMSRRTSEIGCHGNCGRPPRSPIHKFTMRKKTAGKRSLPSLQAPGMAPCNRRRFPMTDQSAPATPIACRSKAAALPSPGDAAACSSCCFSWRPVLTGAFAHHAFSQGFGFGPPSMHGGGLFGPIDPARIEESCRPHGAAPRDRGRRQRRPAGEAAHNREGGDQGTLLPMRDKAQGFPRSRPAGAVDGDDRRPRCDRDAARRPDGPRRPGQPAAFPRRSLTRRPCSILSSGGRSPTTSRPAAPSCAGGIAASREVRLHPDSI